MPAGRNLWLEEPKTMERFFGRVGLNLGIRMAWSLLCHYGRSPDLARHTSFGLDMFENEPKYHPLKQKR